MAIPKTKKSVLSENSHKTANSLNRVEALGFAGTFVAAGLIFTFLTKSFDLSVAAILPMHIPVLFAAIILPTFYSLAAALAIPALCTGFIGYPLPSNSIWIMIELVIVAIVISVLTSRICGSRIYQIILFTLAGIAAGVLASAFISAFRTEVGTLVYFVETYVTSGGIALLLYTLLIPPIAIKLKNAIH